MKPRFRIELAEVEASITSLTSKTSGLIIVSEMVLLDKISEHCQIISSAAL